MEFQKTNFDLKLTSLEVTPHSDPLTIIDVPFGAPRRSSMPLKENNSDKDEQITKLLEQIDNLKSKNKALHEEIHTLSKHNNYSRTMNELETITNKSIEQINNIKLSCDNKLIQELKSENQKLRQMYGDLENKYLTTVKEFTTNNLEDSKNEEINVKNLENISSNFRDFFQKLQVELESSHKNEAHDIIDSYRNIYSDSRVYVNCLIKQFMKKKDLFGNKIVPTLESNDRMALSARKGDKSLFTNGSTVRDTIREEYVKLKKAFVKVNLLNTYYEKIIFDLMNRMLLDIKKFEIESRIKIDLQEKVGNFNKILIMYLEVLNELKGMQKSEVECSPNELIKDSGFNRLNPKSRITLPLKFWNNKYESADNIRESFPNEHVIHITASGLNSGEKMLDNVKSDEKSTFMILEEKPSSIEGINTVSKSFNVLQNLKLKSQNNVMTYNQGSPTKTTSYTTPKIDLAHELNASPKKSTGNAIDFRGSFINAGINFGNNLINSKNKEDKDHKENDSSNLTDNTNIIRKNSNANTNNKNNIIKAVTKNSGLKHNLGLLVKGLFKMIDSKKRNSNHKLFGIPLSDFEDKDKHDDNNNKNSDLDDNTKIIEKKNEEENPEENIFRMFSTQKNKIKPIINRKSAMLKFFVNDNIKKSTDDNNTLRQLRKENALYRDTVETLRNEDISLKAIRAELFKALADFQDNQKLINKMEIENLQKIVKIYKQYFEEELLNNRVSIEELGEIIDDMLLKYF